MWNVVDKARYGPSLRCARCMTTSSQKGRRSRAGRRNEGRPQQLQRAATPMARRDVDGDPYGWMKETTKEVLQHLEAENKHTAEFMRCTRRLQDQLYQKMAPALDRGESPSLPEACGNGYVYYSRRNRGCNLPTYYRRRVGSEGQQGEEEVVLDQNTMPEDHQHKLLVDMKASDAHDLLAFTLAPPVDTTRATLYVRDIRKGTWWTTERCWEGVGNFTWDADRVIFYTRLDDFNRPWRVYVAELLDEPEVGLKCRPRMLTQEDDVRFYVNVGRTKDRRFVTISSNSKTTSEVALVDCTETRSGCSSSDDTAAGVTAAMDSQYTPKVVRPRKAGVQYFVDHGDDTFFIVTSEGSKMGEYRLVSCPTHDPGGWQAVDVGSQVPTAIVDFDLFKRYCVLYERAMGVPCLRVLERQGDAIKYHTPELPWTGSTPVGRLQPGLNQDYSSHTVRFSVTSPILPEVTYDYDMSRRRLQEVHREKLPGRPSVDPSERYQCNREWLQCNDEVEIPLTLVHRRGDTKNCVGAVLYGYGAYGVPLDLGYKAEAMPLLDMGWMLAYAHVRGGGELGRAWHAAGRGPNKPRSIADYITCAQHVRQHHLRPEAPLVGYGGSAGALLVASAAIRAPELFAAMVLKMPFLDIAGAMADPSLPLTEHEYDEWGDAREPAVLQFLRSYSPYELLPTHEKPLSLPSTLVVTSLADVRVQYWHAAKWVAKARAAAHEDRKAEILLRVDRDVGHDGPMTQDHMLREAAYEWSFILKATGMAK